MIIKIHRRKNNIFFKLYFFFLLTIFSSYLLTNFYHFSTNLAFLRWYLEIYRRLSIVSCRVAGKIYSLRRNERNISLFPSLLNFFRLPFTFLPNFFPCNRCQDIYYFLTSANNPHHRFPSRFPLPISPFLLFLPRTLLPLPTLPRFLPQAQIDDQLIVRHPVSLVSFPF